MCSNKLDELPSLKDLHHLKALHLKYNNFTQLPPQLAALPLLEQLDISGNQIRVLDDVLLLGLPKLRYFTTLAPEPSSAQPPCFRGMEGTFRPVSPLLVLLVLFSWMSAAARFGPWIMCSSPAFPSSGKPPPSCSLLQGREGRKGSRAFVSCIVCLAGAAGHQARQNPNLGPPCFGRSGHGGKAHSQASLTFSGPAGAPDHLRQAFWG